MVSSYNTKSEKPIMDYFYGPPPSCEPVTSMGIQTENEPVDGWCKIPVSVIFYASVDPGCGLLGTYATLYNPDEVIEVKLLKEYFYWESGIYKVTFWSVGTDGHYEYEETHKSKTFQIDNTTPYISDINILRDVFTITIQADIMDNHSGVFGGILYIDDKIIDSDYNETPNNNIVFNWTIYKTEMSWGKHIIKVVAMDIIGLTQSKEISFNIPKSKAVLFNIPLLECFPFFEKILNQII
jgi:hypothetical protein